MGFTNLFQVSVNVVWLWKAATLGYEKNYKCWYCLELAIRFFVVMVIEAFPGKVVSLPILPSCHVCVLQNCAYLSYFTVIQSHAYFVNALCMCTVVSQNLHPSTSDTHIHHYSSSWNNCLPSLSPSSPSSQDPPTMSAGGVLCGVLLCLPVLLCTA